MEEFKQDRGYTPGEDCLGITNANQRSNAVMEKVGIQGYKMICDRGRQYQVKQNSRVVAFIREKLSYNGKLLCPPPLP